MAAPSAASANDHLIKVTEVFAGSPGAPNAQFVELQMFVANQVTLTNNEVHVYDDTGAPIDTFVFAANPASGTNQSSVLVATPEAATFFGVAADLTMDPVIPSGNPGEGGKVCYEDVDGMATMGLRDCVSFGPFLGDPNGEDGMTGTPETMLDDTGNPFGPIEGIEPGHAMLRDISAGNPGLLEDADDTGDSAADFDEPAEPAPRNNAGATTTTAGSAAIVGGVLEYDAAAGVTNRLKITRSAGMTIINDSSAPIAAGAGCNHFHVNEVRCAQPGGATVDLGLGDQNDVVMGPNGMNLVVNAGTGNDRITTRSGNDDLFGEDGNDTLAPGTGDDDLDGGTGIDTATYVDRSVPLAIDIDDVADDGDPALTELDNVMTTVERLVGGSGGDTLTGSGIANRITGGLGGDDLSGGAGSDMMISGTVATSASDAGQDDILCGLGANDQVAADTVTDGDTFPTSGPERCEIVLP